jgi:hypothetical protein
MGVRSLARDPAHGASASAGAPRTRSRIRAAAAGLALAAWAGACPAAARTPIDPLPAAASAVLQRRFPELHVIARAQGALHADGAHDVVVVLGRGERGARIVSVLWNDAGGFRFADASGDIDAACPGCEVAVRIRDRVLEVGTSDPGDAMASVHAWRFAYRGTRGSVLRLVGVRNDQIWRGGDAAEDVIDNVASTDLLTGDKVDVIEGALHGRATRRRADTRVPLRQPILFDQFSFDPRSAPAEMRFVFGRDFGKH